jgi:hypothetical protein
MALKSPSFPNHRQEIALHEAYAALGCSHPWSIDPPGRTSDKLPACPQAVVGILFFFFPMKSRFADRLGSGGWGKGEVMQEHKACRSTKSPLMRRCCSWEQEGGKFNPNQWNGLGWRGVGLIRLLGIPFPQGVVLSHCALRTPRHSRGLTRSSPRESPEAH